MRPLLDVKGEAPTPAAIGGRRGFRADARRGHQAVKGSKWTPSAFPLHMQGMLHKVEAALQGTLRYS
jgi:hypothetical protein